MWGSVAALLAAAAASSGQPRSSGSACDARAQDSAMPPPAGGGIRAGCSCSQQGTAPAAATAKPSNAAAGKRRSDWASSDECADCEASDSDADVSSSSESESHAAARAACKERRESPPSQRSRAAKGAGKANVSGSSGTEDSCAEKRKRPDQDEYRKENMRPEVIRRVVTDSHECDNTYFIDGEEVPCHHELWARFSGDAVRELTKQRHHVHSLSLQARREVTYSAIEFEAATGDLHSTSAAPPQVRFLVGPRGGRKRQVCRCIFLAHYPQSNSTLSRIIRDKKEASGFVPVPEEEDNADQQQHLTDKTAHVITWWLNYADETSEKLPDIDVLMTPHRFLKDIHADFVKESEQQGVPESEICGYDHFVKTFKTVPELRNITIASGNAQELLDRKQERMDHHKSARADKLSYYAFRKKAKSSYPTLVSAIIDKMDGNKNKLPSFTRSPKNLSEPLRDAMKLHVAGVIIHGSPDSVHLFSVAPNLAGNANLNCECLYRAMKADFEAKGMLPTLHVELDNAADNKNRWVLAFFAWMIELGWVEEVTVSMMEVGHTHEDIDAIFRQISQRWQRDGKVLTPSGFMRMLQAAVPGAKVHPVMTYVHDWQTFFNNDVYDSVEYITTAREFILRKREDGVVCFWYKPSSSHKTLYPCAKDENGNPIEITSNGERAYQHCPYGIEVFKTGSAPRGTPGLAEFAREVNNTSQPRFKLEQAEANVNTIMTKMPSYFDKTHKDEWAKFFEEFPRTVNDIKSHQVEHIKLDAIPPSSLRLPTGSGLEQHQDRLGYAESITYNNATSGHYASSKSLRLAEAAAADVPILSEGHILCVLPDEDYLGNGGAAFWLAQVEVNEVVDTDEYGRRLNPVANDDEITVAWMGAVDGKGVMAKKNVQGKWKVSCKNLQRGRQMVKHALEEEDGGCCNHPEKEVDTIARGSVLVYNIELTGGEKRLTALSKTQIIDALKEQSKFAYQQLPAGWKEAHEAPKGPKKKFARTR